MNFTDINAKPCRIMWSQRDPSLRKTGLGNVFVRNLAPSVDNKGLYDTFSVFGNILSCKVATDEKGESKGYGYVHFETGEAAQDAIQKFDGMLIEDMEVHVGHFVRRQDRAGQVKWTNLYVKQFPLSWDDATFKETFAAFGAISSAAMAKDEEGKSKGFGFVNYENHEAAAKAVEELHGKVVSEGEASFTLYVGRAQKKADRERELKSRQDNANIERATKFQGMNLYVKNIADTVTDEQFREAFAPYGAITSARIMRDGGEAKTSKGFGFVCFTSQEEANKAVAEMNGKVLGAKPLVVTFYQKKDFRRAQLAAQYAPQNMRFPPQAMTGGMPMPFMNMYMPGQLPGQPGFGMPGQQPRGLPAGYPYPPQQPGGMPRGPAGPGGMPRGPGGPMPFGAPRPGFPAFPGAVPQFMQPGQMPRGPRGQPGFPPLGQSGMPNMPPANFAQGPGAQGRRMPGPGPQGVPMNMPMGPGGPRGAPMGMPGQMAGRPLYPPQVPQGMQVPRGVVPAVKFTNQARNLNGPLPVPGMIPTQPMMGQVQSLPMAPVAGGVPVSSAAAPAKLDFSEALLATQDPVQQKNMIGEKLYPLIHARQPELAGKITGMLLEMDNGELLHLIESPDSLTSKVDEAITVLRNHQAI